jgi:hypothetical protein
LRLPNRVSWFLENAMAQIPRLLSSAAFLAALLSAEAGAVKAQVLPARPLWPALGTRANAAPGPPDRPRFAPAGAAQPRIALAGSDQPRIVSTMLGALSPGAACRQAIRVAERDAGIPTQLMAAIGRVESGRRAPDGRVDPWPWSVNAEGTDHVYTTKAEAVAAVRAMQAQGMRSIDVGCMQINLMHHPDAFASLEEAFEPLSNARYAARFLTQLHAQTGDWRSAAAMYHSATPDIGADYERRVMAVWPEEMRQPHDAPLIADSAAWSAPRLTGGLMLPGGTLGGMLRPLPSAPARPAFLASATPGAPSPGRGLDAYRSAPIAVTSRTALAN